jgi:chemotaxis signal transduction protein
MQHNEDLSHPDVVAILKKRAALLAVEKNNEALGKQDSLLVFKVGEEEKYALYYDSIERVIPYQFITWIPNAPLGISGVIYHDGQVLPVVSLSALFGLKTNNNALSSTYFILINQQTRIIVLWVTAVIGQMDFNKKHSALTVLTNQEIPHQTLFQGICHGDITVLKAAAFFDNEFYTN